MFPGATEAHALPFATTNYEADEDGTLHAVLPSRCVYATGEQTCAMFVDHYRKRKTGPCYPVAVVGCRVHGKRRYTLYPAGHYPYGRVAVVAYSVGGELLREADHGGPAWQATLFGAAQDAARERIWRSEQHWWERLDGYRRRTQGRRLEMAGRLTGVSGGLKKREREQIATRLGVATMTVLSGAHRWGRSWQSRGTPRCRRRPGRPGRSPGAHQRAYPATLARSLGERQARRPGAAATHPYRDLTGTERRPSRFLFTEKQRDPRASAPELVRRARALGIIPVDLKIDRTTVWRACRRMSLPPRRRPHKREGDTRRWRYAERMQCVLADGKHFRAGAARLRRVALFFIDDATRYGLQVMVGTAADADVRPRRLRRAWDSAGKRHNTTCTLV